MPNQTNQINLPWLEQIPQDWKLFRAKNIFNSIDIRSTTGQEQLLSVSEKHGVTQRKNLQVTMFKAESYVGHKLTWADDLVINSLWAWMGGLGVSKFHGIVSTAYGVYRLKQGYKHMARYLDYLLRSNLYRWELRVNSKGIWRSRYQLTDDSFFSLPMLVLPNEITLKIVKYLDYKCAQINKFIQKKKRLIELLNEQKQAIINQAVTRGLDLYVRLKPSGVEWLGDIPEHWDIAALKHLAALKSGESITSLSIDEIGSYPVYGGNGIRGYTSSFTHQGLYPLIGRQGALCGNVHLVEGKFWASEHAVVVKPKINLSTTWLTYLLKVMNLNQYSESAAQPGLSVSKIQNLKVPFPSFNEQSSIADHIELKITPLESIITQINKQIHLIQEYRTRLISDVVTGQLDVRNIKITDIVEEERIEDVLEEEQEEESLELIGAGDDD